jgi:S1-C subfamily serine protease
MWKFVLLIRGVPATLFALVLALSWISESHAERTSFSLVQRLANGELVEVRDGDLLSVGARIRLQLNSSQRLKVQAIYIDQKGQRTTLARRKEIPVGGRLVLPGGQRWYEVSDGSGLEKFRLVGTTVEGKTIVWELSFQVVSKSAAFLPRQPRLPPNDTTAPKAPSGNSPKAIGLLSMPVSELGQAENLRLFSKRIADLGIEGQSLQTRGAREVRLFKAASPAVVLVFTKRALGSGSIISRRGLIVTNWHVIGNERRVRVILKPKRGLRVRASHAYDARVVRVDRGNDLALIQLVRPPRNLPVLSLGRVKTVQVGEDVHAIGHPKGQWWTYTRGYISQIRVAHKWSYKLKSGKKRAHVGTVIQTQTPINTGNSGGPLLGPDGRIIGVNTFGDAKRQGMNYAVSVEHVRRLIAGKLSRPIATRPTATRRTGLRKKRRIKWHPVDRNKNGRPDGYWADLNGNGKPDAFIIDKNEDGVTDYILLDRNENGKPDVKIVVIRRRGKKITVWYYDRNEDGKADVVGIDLNNDGKIDRYKRLT